MGFQILAQFRWGTWGFHRFYGIPTHNLHSVCLVSPNSIPIHQQGAEAGGGACSCLGQRRWWFILWLLGFSSTTSLVLSFSEAAFLSCIVIRMGSTDCAQCMVLLSTPVLSPSFVPISCFSPARWFHPTLPLPNVTSSSGEPSLTAQLHSQLALFKILMASSSGSQTSKCTWITG